ncbi:MAG: glycogen/starch synthase [Muribaculaceae bacterium]
MANSNTMPDILFETSWEVCNKVGGIYAVLSTKAKTLQKQMKDSVIFLGPDIWEEQESPYFKETKSLLSDWKKTAKLPNGVTVRVGRWEVPGKPIAILVNFKSLFAIKDELYGKMWNEYQVDSLHAYGDYDEACAFAYASALVIESLAKHFGKRKKMVAHFNEWTVGMGLLYLKSVAPHIATVFTTHATSIGRSICGNNKPLYDYMAGYNGDQMAQELNMQSKHSLEKTAAHQADAFTTVSDVTARECQQLLEIDPYVTPNAFEQNFVPKAANYVAARTQARKKMLTVASALLGEEFDDNTLIVATSGRNEFRNKGLDAFIDAINVVRNDMRFSNRKVVAFMMVPAWTDKAFPALASAVEENRTERQENTLLTHDIFNYNSDNIYLKMRELNFTNFIEDRVKLIYVPCYLNGNDGIFNMSYYDLIPGFDLSVFASYYEPWGYTPLESIAFGVPTITTDLSGFGQWVNSNYENGNCGVRVIHRTDSNYGELVNAIAQSIETFSAKSQKEVDEQRRVAQKVAKAASWDNFIKYYNEVYSIAIKNAKNRNK